MHDLIMSCVNIIYVGGGRVWGRGEGGGRVMRRGSGQRNSTFNTFNVVYHWW